MAIIKLKVNAMICLFFFIRGGVEAKIQIKVHCEKNSWTFVAKLIY